MLELLAADPASLSSITDPEQAWRAHVADSLTGLDLLGEPERLADVGAGAGFPGLVLAAALPASRVDLIESVQRKCEFIARAAEAARLTHAVAVCARAETWAAAPASDGGREAYDAVTARAVGRLATLAELASPLLREGGALVAWKGRRNGGEEAELERAAAALAMGPAAVLRPDPALAAGNRHLYVIHKQGETPRGLPRRPGMAKKRPYGTTAPAA